MDNYPIPFDEERRQRILDETGALETDEWAELDALTSAASSHWRVPIAIVSLLDNDRQYFKSCVGLGVDETERELAFCAHTIMYEHALVVPDARKDKRFCDNALVTGAPHIRFYAGAPIIVDKSVVGSFCIIDTTPRSCFSATDKERLQSFADLAAQIIITRRNISFRKLSIEEQLVQAATHRKHAHQERAGFLAMVSHELRTPLHQMSGFIDLLENIVSTEEGRHYLGYIGDAARQLQDLTESALRFAAADFGRLPMNRERFSLQDSAIRGVHQRNMEIEFDVPGPLVIEADELHFRQIFASIASAFGHCGATALGIAKDQSTEESLRLLISPVGSDGTNKLHKNCLDPFGNSDTFLERGQEGFDLGLALARRLARAHGAELSFVHHDAGKHYLQLDLPQLLICENAAAA